MAIRVGIIGAGWPGVAHAKGYQSSGGFKIVAVADLIPERRKRMMADFGAAREYADARDLLIADRDVDAVSICLPNHLHAPTAVAALKAGKHVVMEVPPVLNAKEARQIESAATKAGRSVLYAFQRRFGGAELASKQAIAKGYAGDPYHARAVWTRSRGIPIGTGWYTQKEKSGGGALLDVGLHMLDLAWSLLGQPAPTSAYALTHQRFRSAVPADLPYDVDDAAFAILRFEGGKSLELASSWALNQPPQQNGTVCRIYGTTGGLEVYTAQGAVLYRGIGPKGEAKETALKGPKLTHHAAMMRHFRECILGKASPLVGPREGHLLMQMVDALYKSADSGKSVNINAGSSTPTPAATAAAVE